MCKFLKRAWAEIDLSALEKNYLQIKNLAGEKEVLAVVKANAYGHDDVSVSAKLQSLGVKYFGVSNLWEAEKLRNNNITGTILIFGYTDEGYFEDLAKYDITQTVGSVEYANLLNNFAAEKGIKLPVHIKINTGMTRVGIDSEQEIEEILALENLHCTAAYTHFAVADSLDGNDIAYTNEQYNKIIQIAKNKGLLIHCQNSGGILYHSQFEADIVRAGIILYGNSPSYNVPVPMDLHPLMKVKTVVTQLKTIPKGTAVSYGLTYTADSPRLIAVVSIGYADGYLRAFSNKGKMAVNGVVVPVIGRVCMDQVILDVTDVPNIKDNDEVEVYSDSFTETGIDYNAEMIGTIGYELTCDVAARVPRVIIEDGKIQKVIRYM